jgi:prepilin-type N-terminal cleavage/methylation domain-containing protein
MRQRSQGGFTLLELTIVLAIVGLLAVGALKAVSALRENAGISETSKRLDTLVMALQTFLMKNNRLPCPADPDIDTKFGDELCPSTPLSGVILGGVIPGRALGLSGGRLLDAWDRQFTYVVVAEAIQNNSFTSNAWPATLELRDKAGGELIRQGIAVIISHGANGGDTHQPSDATLGVKSPTDEEENVNNDHTFVQAPYSTNEKNPFDDQVLVLTEDQIVQPLANQGALKTKQAQALEKLKRIENALIGFIVAHALICPPGKTQIPFSANEGEVQPSVLDLESEDVLDPWGRAIDYIIKPNPGSDCFEITKDIKVTLRSRGLDGERDQGNTNKDDIKRIVIKSRFELQGILADVGIKVVPPASSSSPQPIKELQKWPTLDKQASLNFNL